MDVVFEEVEEGVVDEVDGAVDVAFYAEDEFEGSAGFVAGEGGDVDELVVFVGDVFACFTVILRRRVSVYVVCLRSRSKGDMSTLR